MKNYIQEGKTYTGPAPANVSSGEFVVFNAALSGVAIHSALNTAACTVERRGAFTLPKATGEAWTPGDLLYWDATNKRFTKTSSGNTLRGMVYEAAISGATSGVVYLDGVAR